LAKKARGIQRREESLSPDRIIEASIELLDGSGERGLTFRALSERLATGPGAIYWHISSKGELLTAACDAIVADAMNAPVVGSTPKAIIRAVALALFDAIDALKAEAHRRGLTDDIVDAELAAYNAERRERNAPPAT